MSFFFNYVELLSFIFFLEFKKRNKGKKTKKKKTKKQYKKKETMTILCSFFSSSSTCCLENNKQTSPNITRHFKIPIWYNKDKKNVSEILLRDLELIHTTNGKRLKNDKEEEEEEEKEQADDSMKPLYMYCFNLQEEKKHNIKKNTSGFSEITFAKEIIEKQFSQVFTTDILFLKENQQLLKILLQENEKEKEKDTTYAKVYELWTGVKYDPYFKELYNFIDWPCLEFLNRNEFFLQVLSVYSMMSPLVSFIMPVIILILPFFIIQYQGLECTFEEYMVLLEHYIQTNALGRLFTNFHMVSFQEKGYLLFSAMFYIFSIYQNLQLCYKFHRNMKNIHLFFHEMKQYIAQTQKRMANYVNLTQEFSADAQVRFRQKVSEIMKVLDTYLQKLQRITEFKYSAKKIMEIGLVLKTFYDFHAEDALEEAIEYSFGFHGYMDCLEGMVTNVKEKKMAFASFLSKEEKDDEHEHEHEHEHEKKEQEKKEQEKEKDDEHEHEKKEKEKEDDAKKEDNQKKENEKRKKLSKEEQSHFKQSFYAAHKDSDAVVKNNVYLNKHLILSGPNASGKTTIMKTTLLNILFSQQFGCGFYEDALLKPFDYLHCYLNIPDTSGRDSLFQAEARRCKDILEEIQQVSPTVTHFCAFDEIYSGTNPKEAAKSAIAFLQYLAKRKNVTTILTTHFIEVCQELEKQSPKFQNYHMQTEPKENEPQQLNYLYLMKKGISTVEGGFSVLHDLNYPKEILDLTYKPQPQQKTKNKKQKTGTLVNDNV